LIMRYMASVVEGIAAGGPSIFDKRIPRAFTSGLPPGQQYSLAILCDLAEARPDRPAISLQATVSRLPCFRPAHRTAWRYSPIWQKRGPAISLQTTVSRLPGFRPANRIAWRYSPIWQKRGPTARPFPCKPPFPGCRVSARPTGQRGDTLRFGRSAARPFPCKPPFPGCRASARLAGWLGVSLRPSSQSPAPGHSISHLHPCAVRRNLVKYV